MSNYENLEASESQHGQSKIKTTVLSLFVGSSFIFVCFSIVQVLIFFFLFFSFKKNEIYEFETKYKYLKMKDGIELSCTLLIPKKKISNEKFPILLEYLPYRKDDGFYIRDWYYFQNFVIHGYIIAKVDIRGTGSSNGKLPNKEYSDAELEDAEEIINQLSRLEDSNGNVGMYGISWGAFNGIMLTTKNISPLKTIVGCHGSEGKIKL